jgi:hypothetical protein
MRNGYIVLTRNPKEKRPLGRPRCRWKKSVLGKQDGRCGLDAFGLEQGPVAGALHGNEL